MDARKLESIKKNIRENWGKIKPFERIPKRHFNCYMFAVCCTEPTEIIPVKGEAIHTTGEDISYFGDIGNFSNTKYQTDLEFKQALINDLKVLGISAKEISGDFVVPDNSIKIAFFSNFKTGMSADDMEFHFIRFIPELNYWMDKVGFYGDIKARTEPDIYNILFMYYDLIGVFQLDLI